MYQALDSVELIGLSPKITKAAAEFSDLIEWLFTNARVFVCDRTSGRST